MPYTPRGRTLKLMDSGLETIEINEIKNNSRRDTGGNSRAYRLTMTNAH